MILDEIVAWKRKEVAERKRSLPAAQLPRRKDEPRPFEKSLSAGPGLKVLAEIKRASPSAGEIRPGADAAELARLMEAAGASALSVLTDANYFGGSLEDLAAARSAVSLPVLEKEFVVEEYQVHEAYAWGADAVLLIVRVLGDDELERLYRLARERGLGCLVEAHDSEDLDRALSISPPLVGINNRDLSTFEVDIETTLRLLPEVPEGVAVVSQSGISTPEQARRLREAGVSAIQVGESLMRAADPAAKLAELLSLVY